MIDGVPDAALVALISGVLTGLGIVLNNRIAKRKAPSDAAAAISAAAASVVEILRSDNAELRRAILDLRLELKTVMADLADCKAEHAEKDTELERLRGDIDALRDELREHYK